MAALALVEMLHHSMRVTRVAACAVIANLLQIRADRPGVPPGSTKALLLPKIDPNRGQERDARHVVL